MARSRVHRVIVEVHYDKPTSETRARIDVWAALKASTQQAEYDRANVMSYSRTVAGVKRAIRNKLQKK